MSGRFPGDWTAAEVRGALLGYWSRDRAALLVLRWSEAASRRRGRGRWRWVVQRGLRLWTMDAGEGASPEPADPPFDWVDECIAGRVEADRGDRGVAG